ncbi:MAG TPA: hypothetical protein PLV62_06960 [Spirochaetota bacterium]|nr:hypothetical protein [Spirochaetota bacterium]
MNTATTKGIIKTMSPMCQIVNTDTVNNKLMVFHRRDKYLVRDAENNLRAISILAPSSNTIRATIRDLIAADITDALLKKNIKLGYKSLLVLYVGGGGVESESKRSLQEIEKLKEHNVVLSLLGASPDKIIAGKTVVGMPVLICDETVSAGLIPGRWYNEYGALPHYTDVLDIKQLIRHDDLQEYDVVMRLSAQGFKELEEFDAALASKKAEKSSNKTTEEEKLAKEIKSKTSRQTIYNVETIVPGALFYHYITIRNPRMLEIGALLGAFRRFAKDPFIGGGSSKGYGEISIDYDFCIDDEVVGKIKVNENSNRKTEIDDISGTVLADALAEYNKYIENITEDQVAI